MRGLNSDSYSIRSLQMASYWSNSLNHLR